MFSERKKATKQTIVPAWIDTVGAPPGSYTKEPASAPPQLHLISYDKTQCEETRPSEVSEALSAASEGQVTWLNIEGNRHSPTLSQLTKLFRYHPLSIEDVANSEQSTKIEEYDNHLFLAFKMPLPHTDNFEQVSIFMSENLVVSVQESSGIIFNPIRERIRSKLGRIRRSGADYLVYSLIDALIDSYFPLLEDYGRELEALEAQLIEESSRQDDRAIYALKKDLYAFRRSLWPLREVVSTMMRREDSWFDENTQTYLRDCHDHTSQLLNIVGACLEMCSSLVDLSRSAQTNRMNDVMKMLTLIATIFMPLGFIAGVYGMNFDRAHPWNMPELGWAWGYPGALSLMAITTLSFLVYFRSKGWLGGN